MTRSPAARPLRDVVSEPAEPALFRTVWILSQAMRLFSKQDWRAQEKVPATGGAVLVVNHISNVDPISFGHYLAYSGRWPRYLAKASLFKVPLLGRLVTAAGQIPVERESVQAAGALGQVNAAVRAGKCVIIYPEGTITKDPDLWPMTGKTGAARVAFETGCPVIPFGQWGVEEIMYGKRIHFPKLLPRKTLRVLAGDPVDLDDLRSQPVTPETLKIATERIMAAITALVAELRQEQPPAAPFDPRSAAPKTDGETQ